MPQPNTPTSRFEPIIVMFGSMKLEVGKVMVPNLLSKPGIEEFWNNGPGIARMLHGFAEDLDDHDDIDNEDVISIHDFVRTYPHVD